MKRQGPQQPIINHIDVKSVDEYSSKVQQLGGKVHQLMALPVISQSAPVPWASLKPNSPFSFRPKVCSGPEIIDIILLTFSQKGRNHVTCFSVNWWHIKGRIAVFHFL
jgi:hypothetical protein